MTRLFAGTIHNKIPQDMRRMLLASDDVQVAWQSLTPLARNEWICWIENAKLNETRARRIERAHDDLEAGKRRPCCWMGCIHRTDKAISPSVRGILEKRSKQKSGA